jgi:hypothetical protein
VLELYLISLFSLILTEYGFQTRKRALLTFEDKWHWCRTLFRGFIWVGAFGYSNQIEPRRAFIYYAFAFLLGELWAYLFRHFIKRDIERGFAYGRPGVHMLPFLFTAIMPLILQFLPYGLEPGSRISGGISAPVLLGPVLALVMLWNWATLFTVSVLSLVRPEQVEEEIHPLIGAGEVIGILERLITFMLVSVGGFAAVGFVVAAKAAVRYPQFKKREFAEYFLIGTLCSVGIAVLTALTFGVR